LLVVDLVHKAGVIHCDLYPSNIMWRRRRLSTVGGNPDELVDIVIIDWDCAHCLIEGRFHPKVKDALQSHKPTCDAEFGTAFDDRFVRVLDREYIASEDAGWADLASGVKELIDSAFYHFFRTSRSL
jgi:serine/threonine protein kinase